MESKPMDPGGIDASAFGAIAAESARTLDAVAAALAQWQTDGAAGALPPVACRELRQVRAVLEVAGIAGVPQLLRELEAILDDVAAGRAPDVDVALGVSRRALGAIQRSVADAARGVPPEALAPVLQELICARGSDRLAAMELFHPDLSRLQARPDDATNASGAAVELLRGARARFQKGLLSWLREADRTGLLAMREAVENVEASCAGLSARAPWWLAAGFLDLLIASKPEPLAHAKHVFSALDQYLRKVIEGSAEMPESLVREMLYVLALTDPVTERVASIRESFRLGATTPARTVADAPGMAATLENQRQRLQELEQLLERATSADEQSLQAFLTGIEDAAREAPHPGLAALLTEMIQAGTAMRDQPAQARAGLAVELATALLFLQDSLAQWSRSGSAPAAGEEENPVDSGQIEAIARRLREARTGQFDRTPRVSLQTGAARRGHDQALAERVGSELVSALTAAAQALGAYFEDRTAREALATAEGALTRARGVLQVLGEGPAAVAAGFCIQQIERFRVSEHASVTEDFGRVAAVLSGLSYYIEQLGNARPDFAAIMLRAGAPEWIGAGSPPSMVPPAPCDVLDLTEALEEAAAATSRDEYTPMAAPAVPLLAVRQDGEQSEGHWDQAANADLLQVFSAEAVDILSAARDAIARLHERHDDAEAMVTIRRCFHTLKGSGRMVELEHFGEAAWAVEQVMNGVIQRGAQATAGLLQLLELATMRGNEWVAQLRTQGKARIDAGTLHLWAGHLRRGEPFPAADEAQRAPATEPPPAAAAVQTVEIGGVKVSQALFDVFMTEARNIAAALQGELDSMKAAPGRESGHELFRLAHTLGGIAATVGVDAIRDLAGALEGATRSRHYGGLQFSAQDRALLGEVNEELRAMIASVGARVLPQPRVDLQTELQSLAQRLDQALPTDSGAQPDVSAGEMLSAPGEEDSSATEQSLPDTSRQGFVEALEYEPVKRVDRRRSRLEDDIDRHLLPIFLEEAADIVPRIGAELRLWRARPEERALSQSLARLLHTLKGSARMAGAMGLGELTHSMETRVSVAAQLAVIPQSVFDGLEASFDRIGVLLERFAPTGEAQARDNDASGTMARAAATVTSNVDAVTAQGGARSTGAAMAALGQPPAARAPAQLRVRADLVEKLVADAGEVTIARSRAEGEVRAMRTALRDMAGNLARLRALARELEIQAESQIQSRIVQAQGADDVLDPLEFDRFTRLQELTRSIAESASDAATLQQGMSRSVDGCNVALAAQARMTRVLQDGLMGVRMIAFSSLNERLFRVVRLTAREAGKRISLDIRGASIELDRGVIERMTGPLEHLLRNAVVHGIETADERRAAGKAEAGEITLDLRQEGNEVVLILQDDGRGLDIPALRERAIAAGLMTAEPLLGDTQVAQFAFAAGVSTAQNVTEAAGRGVGLDVVRSEVTALGGRVDVAFEPGMGATFTIHLPLKVAVMQALLVRCAGQLFALPTLMVEQIRTFNNESLERLREAGRVDWHGRAYPVHELRMLLQMRDAQPQPQRYVPMALVRGGTQRAAVQVDEIVGHEEVVVKNIGAQVARVTGITGAAVRGSGEIVLIVNPLQLTQRGPGHPAPPAVQRANDAAKPAALTVLVVDDSATVRKITGRVLSRQGYQVVEARDGIEALEKLQGATPGVMLLDVEMPRMDGFELLRRVREDSRWKDLPIIMITSRTAEKHRQVAMQLGATLFLGKPFEEQELLAQVANVITSATA